MVSSFNFLLLSLLVIVILLCRLPSPGLCSKSKAINNSKVSAQLKHHGEIHQAKNLIDALSSKLRLNQQTYHNKYSTLQQESSLYLSESIKTRDEIKTLTKLKLLLNELTGQSSICEEFYSDFDFTVVRPIVIKTTSSALPKHFTVKLQGKETNDLHEELYLFEWLFKFSCISFNRNTTAKKNLSAYFKSGIL